MSGIHSSNEADVQRAVMKTARAVQDILRQLPRINPTSTHSLTNRYQKPSEAFRASNLY